jgi:hypothetical protein
MLAARGILYPFFGLTSPLLLDLTALAFLVYAAAISVVAMRPVISRGALMTIVCANIAYVLASLAVLITFWAHLDPIGRALIIAVTFVVEAFATLQFAAARRAPSGTALTAV